MRVRLRHSASEDQGFAMAVVMGAIALITVVSVGGFAVAQQTLHESVRVRDENTAFQVANSGIDVMLSSFPPHEWNGQEYKRPDLTIPGSAGTYDIEVRRLDTYEYIMVATGRMDGVTERVTQRFFYLDLWDMNIGAGENASLGGGAGWNGNASITGPFYVRGDLNWSANAAFEGGPLFIRDGQLKATGSGTLGQNQPIYLYATGGISSDSKPSNIYLAKPVSHSVPDIQLPWVTAADMQRWYVEARDQSVDNIMGSPYSRSTNNSEVTNPSSPDPNDYPDARRARTGAGMSRHYKYVGPSSGPAIHPSLTTRGNTPLQIGVTPGVSFGRWAGEASGTYAAGSGLHDDFAYDDADGTLYIEGTVFIDGNLTIGPRVRNYTGNGTLVVNGDVQIDTRDLLPRTGLSPAECLGIVTPFDVYLGRQNTRARMLGAVFSNGTFGLYGNDTRYEGSILAGQIYSDRPNIHLVTNPNVPPNLPDSMPGAGGGIVFRGVWSRY